MWNSFDRAWDGILLGEVLLEDNVMVRTKGSQTKDSISMKLKLYRADGIITTEGRYSFISDIRLFFLKW